MFLYVQNQEDSQHYFLCGRRSDKTRDWTIPGGHVEPGQTYAQAGARELFEETAKFYGYNVLTGEKGVFESVNPEQLLGVPYSESIGRRTGNLHFLFFYKAKNRVSADKLQAALLDPSLTKEYKEMTEYKWVPVRVLKEAIKKIPQAENSYGTWTRIPLTWKAGNEIEIISLWVRISKIFTSESSRKAIADLPD